MVIGAPIDGDCSSDSRYKLQLVWAIKYCLFIIIFTRQVRSNKSVGSSMMSYEFSGSANTSHILKRRFLRDGARVNPCDTSPLFITLYFSFPVPLLILLSIVQVVKWIFQTSKYICVSEQLFTSYVPCKGRGEIKCACGCDLTFTLYIIQLFHEITIFISFELRFLLHLC